MRAAEGLDAVDGVRVVTQHQVGASGDQLGGERLLIFSQWSLKVGLPLRRHAPVQRQNDEIGGRASGVERLLQSRDVFCPGLGVDPWWCTGLLVDEKRVGGVRGPHADGRQAWLLGVRAKAHWNRAGPRQKRHC